MHGGSGTYSVSCKSTLSMSTALTPVYLRESAIPTTWGPIWFLENKAGYCLYQHGKCINYLDTSGFPLRVALEITIQTLWSTVARSASGWSASQVGGLGNVLWTHPFPMSLMTEWTWIHWWLRLLSFHFVIRLDERSRQLWRLGLKMLTSRLNFVCIEYSELTVAPSNFWLSMLRSKWQQYTTIIGLEIFVPIPIHCSNVLV